MNSDWYFILLFLLAFAMVDLNESGYGLFALLGLPLTYWLMEKAFGKA